MEVEKFVNKAQIFLFFMSKRPHLSTEDEKRAGLHAWETPEGRRWLLKALNPNDTYVPTNGIPTLQCRNISVLNWHGEYGVEAPESISAEIPSYDSTLFLYHHPLIFGLSASRPTGCMDPSEYGGYYEISRTGSAAAGYVYSLSSSAANDNPIALTRIARYLNTQIDPSLFKGDTSLAGRRELFKQLTQKHRIIYGGATIIPTCSKQNDSGTLAVSQQVWNPRKTVIENNTNIELDTFTNEDFPDTSDTVQNPQMYYGQFKDGAYIPYKINEPASLPYVNSEQQITTRSPYYVRDIRFLGTLHGSGNYVIHEIEGVPPKVTQKQFIYTSKEDKKIDILTGIRIYVTFFTGQQGYFTFTITDDATGAVGQPSSVFFTNETGGTKNLLGSSPDVAAKEDTANLPAGDETDYELNGLYLKLPTVLTAWQLNNNTKDLTNPWGAAFVSEDISKNNALPANSELRVGTICPYNGNSIITVHTSGVSNTAPIRMILRYGTEILLVSSSPYSPFKFMSPRYDESAIKSYARCIRNMRDAYFANAGSIPGQVDYVNKMMNLIENDSGDGISSVLNQGGSWYGMVL